MNSKREALRLLRDALGDRTAKFRAGQWDAIDALVNRRERRMVVERTGWGKSMVQEKLGLNSKQEIVVWAVRNGLLDDVVAEDG